MKQILLLLCLFAATCMSCNKKETKQSPSSRTRVVNSLIGTKHESSPKSQSHSINETSTTFYKYQFSNDTVFQKISLYYLSKSKIVYNYQVYNKLRNLRDSIKGQAVANLDQDPEINNDDNGDAYFCTEYNDVRTGEISFRIDIDTRRKVQIISDEQWHNENYCPFNSLGILVYKGKVKGLKLKSNE